MPRLSNMRGETGRVEIAVPGDEPLVVVYRRGALTARLQAELREVQRLASDEARHDEITAEHIMLTCRMYAELIASWNLTDDDGAVIPVDVEHLADVAQSVLALISEAIQKETAPDPLSDGASSNGSSPTAGSGRPRITTAS